MRGVEPAGHRVLRVLRQLPGLGPGCRDGPAPERTVREARRPRRLRPRSAPTTTPVARHRASGSRAHAGADTGRRRRRRPRQPHAPAPVTAAGARRSTLPSLRPDQPTRTAVLRPLRSPAAGRRRCDPSPGRGAGRAIRLLVVAVVRQPRSGGPPGVSAQPARALPLAPGPGRARPGRPVWWPDWPWPAGTRSASSWRATTTYAEPWSPCPSPRTAIEPPDATVPKSEPAALTDRTEAAWTMRWEPAAEGGSCGGAPGTGVIVLTIAPTRVRALTIQAGLLADDGPPDAAGPAPGPGRELRRRYLPGGRSGGRASRAGR